MPGCREYAGAAGWLFNPPTRAPRASQTGRPCAGDGSSHNGFRICPVRPSAGRSESGFSHRLAAILVGDRLLMALRALSLPNSEMAWALLIEIIVRIKTIRLAMKKTFLLANLLLAVASSSAFADALPPAPPGRNGPRPRRKRSWHYRCPLRRDASRRSRVRNPADPGTGQRRCE